MVSGGVAPVFSGSVQGYQRFPQPVATIQTGISG
jgi:hypothetical protein